MPSELLQAHRQLPSLLTLPRANKPREHLFLSGQQLPVRHAADPHQQNPADLKPTRTAHPAIRCHRLQFRHKILGPLPNAQKHLQQEGRNQALQRRQPQVRVLLLPRLRSRGLDRLPLQTHQPEGLPRNVQAPQKIRQRQLRLSLLSGTTHRRRQVRSEGFFEAELLQRKKRQGKPDQLAHNHATAKPVITPQRPQIGRSVLIRKLHLRCPVAPHRRTAFPQDPTIQRILFGRGSARVHVGPPQRNAEDAWPAHHAPRPQARKHHASVKRTNVTSYRRLRPCHLC